MYIQLHVFKSFLDVFVDCVTKDNFLEQGGVLFSIEHHMP